MFELPAGEEEEFRASEMLWGAGSEEGGEGGAAVGVKI